MSDVIQDVAQAIVLGDSRLDCLFGDDEGIDGNTIKQAEAAIAAAMPHIRAALFDELIADAFGESFCALELHCDTGSFGGSEYLGTLANWLRARKETTND